MIANILHNFSFFFRMQASNGTWPPCALEVEELSSSTFELPAKLDQQKCCTANEKFEGTPRALDVQ